MSRLLRAYRAMHEQGFVPIFTEDGFDARTLVEACVEAGMTCIEYTQRRRDAREMIPWIRRTFPDLHLLVGSTLDDEGIVARLRRRHPQLMTLAQIAQLDVDGFVSMIGWSEASIRRYCGTHLVMPTAMTVTEAFVQIGAGAHFAKFSGSDLGLVKRCRSDATFGFCPAFVTGGVTLERMDEVMAAGAVLVASGFDLMLKGRPRDLPRSEIAGVLKQYVAAAGEARRRHWPTLIDTAGLSDQAWLDRLPHDHPF